MVVLGGKVIHLRALPAKSSHTGLVESRARKQADDPWDGRLLTRTGLFSLACAISGAITAPK